MQTCTIYYKDDPTNICVYQMESDYVSKMISWNKKFYEWDLLEYIDTHYHEQQNILDIGANIGNHSLFFAKYIKCNHIYAFEPMYENIEIFKKNLENFSDKCTLFEVALGNQENDMIIYNSEKNNNGGFSLASHHNSYEVGTTHVVTLDSFNFKNISLIKLDVENYEIDVLKGGKQTIINSKPMIILENNFHYFSNIYPDPEPHKDIMNELNYIKIHSDLCKSGMDVWVSADKV